MITPYQSTQRTYSKGDVHRAGEALKRFAELSDEEKRSALTTADYWRQLHLYPLNTFQALIRLHLGKIAPDTAMVAQRLKKMPTMIGKLSRMKGGLESMQDIAGIRLVFPSLKSLRQFEKSLTSSRTKHVRKATRDYIAAPKEDGYRSVHLVYQCHSLRKDNPEALQGLPLELQLRTKLQHYWATAVEAVDMFYGQSLKFGSGSQDWHRFFQLVSAAFAIEEGTPLPKEFLDASKEEIYEALRQHTKSMNAMQRLEAISKLTLLSSDTQRAKRDHKERFFLLMLARGETNEAMSIRYMDFDADQEKEANTWYKTLEEGKEDSLWRHLDIVLVRTSRKQLATLYSNYFLDISAFLKALKKLLG